jgi:hypothetical protein
MLVIQSEIWYNGSAKSVYTYVVIFKKNEFLL